MKNIILIIFLMTLLSASAFSQNASLNMNIQKIENTDNWEFMLEYTFSSAVDSGIFIELPANLAATPVSINLNNTEMWLKNSNEIPANDSAVYWETLENGIILRFNSDLIQANSRISVKCISQVSQNLSDDANISIKRMQNRSEISNEIIASNNLNITQ
jgi:hypothetical protein